MSDHAWVEHGESRYCRRCAAWEADAAAECPRRPATIAYVDAYGDLRPGELAPSGARRVG